MKIPLSLAAVLLFCPLVARAQSATSIPQIQGASAISPLVDQVVSVEGVVTGDFQLAEQFSGFYLQDPRGDGDAATSDGVFVYVNARSRTAGVDVQVGQRVRVTGRVEEFGGQTQIGRTSEIEVVGVGQLPTPTPITLPLAANDSFERFENMRVTFPQTLTVTEQGQLLRYGSLTLSHPGRLFVPTNQKPLAQIGEDDASRRSFLLDDGFGAQGRKPVPYLDKNGTRRAGSTTQNVTGILSFAFEKYRLQPTMAPVFKDANPRPLQAPDVGGTLTIGAANIKNYWTTPNNAANPGARGAKNAPEFARQSARTVALLKGLDADVVGLMELENNGEVAMNDLLGKLNAAYGSPVYAKIADLPGFVSPGPIKVGIIYKVARVTPRGAPIVAKDPIFDRYPFAQTFVDGQSGGAFTLIVNHLKSKSPGEEVVDNDKGEGAFNQKRIKQAAKLVEFIRDLQLQTGDPDVLSVGDYNSYTEETPLLNMRRAGLEHLNLRLAPEKRYSFSFDGRYGSLDHAFVTPETSAQVTGYEKWHINADEPYFLEYQFVKVDDFTPSAFRASDHDPFLVGLELKADAPRVARPVTAAKKIVAKGVVQKKVVGKQKARKAK